MKRTLGIFTLLCLVASSSWAIVTTESNTGAKDSQMSGSSPGSSYPGNYNSGAGVNNNPNTNKGMMQKNDTNPNSSTNGSSDVMDSDQH